MAIQKLAPELQLLHLQLDSFRAMEPPGYWDASYRELAPVRIEALCRAMNAAAASFARFGQDVIVDHVLTPQALTYLLEDLKEFQLLFVKVDCGLQALEHREALRTDRALGLAKSQFNSVHTDCSYDYEVDTTARPASELARELADWLSRSPPPAALARMQQPD